jgi:hypothetical protein
MATGDGWTSRLLTGLADHLAANGVGVWRPAGAYEAGEVAIVVRAIPQSPDRLITLAAYILEDVAPGLADSDVGVQIRVRGTTDPRVAEDIGDAVFDLLDSAEHLSWGGVLVTSVARQSSAPLGQDTNDRWEMSHNYRVEAVRPTSNRF